MVKLKLVLCLIAWLICLSCSLNFLGTMPVLSGPFFLLAITAAFRACILYREIAPVNQVNLIPDDNNYAFEQLPLVNPHEQLDNNPRIPPHTLLIAPPQISESKKQLPTQKAPPTNDKILTKLGFQKENLPSKLQKLYESLKCPISFVIMDTPTLLPDGKTVDISTFNKLLANNNPRCPHSRMPIDPLVPRQTNYALKQILDDFMEEYRKEYETKFPEQNSSSSAINSSLSSSSSAAASSSASIESSLTSSALTSSASVSSIGLFSETTSNTSTTYSSDITHLLADMDDMESDLNDQSELRRRTHS